MTTTAIQPSMAHPISGVVPPSVAEATVMTVWPSVGSTTLGKALGRLYRIKSGLGPISVGRLALLATIPLGMMLYLSMRLPWAIRRYRLTNRRVSIERGIRQAKRTVVVLSPAYLADHMAAFQNVLAQTLGIDAGTYPLLPVRFGPLDEGQVPGRLRMLVTLDLGHPQRAEREFDRLVRALRGPLPRRGEP